MARCNHRLTFPIRATAALLANAASISAWATNCGVASSSPSTLRRPMPAHFHSPTKREVSRSNQRRCYSLAASRKLDDGSDGGTGIIHSVKESLRYNLVQPHLDTLSPPYSNNSKNNGAGSDTPTLVLILAVSGGCDSIALFHAVLALTKSKKQCDIDQSECPNDSIPETNPLDPISCLNLGAESVSENDNDDNVFRVPCELHVAHFNHEQREESSDGDELFVKNICQEYGVPFHCYSWSGEGSSPKEESSSTLSKREMANGHYFGDNSNCMTQNDRSHPGSFTQDIARKWRRRKLKELLAYLVLTTNDNDATFGDGEIFQKRWGAILTAHHRDDADETILLKLLRGSHLTNLQSMDAASDGFELRLEQNAKEEDSVFDVNISPKSRAVGYFAKPMLNKRKNHIVEHLKSNSLEWREDESNSSSKYKRNKIRNELMPLLSEIAGGDNALQKRFSNLEQQSKDIGNDLSKRSAEYLRTMPSSSEFLLPENAEGEFGIVQEEALHRWIMQKTNKELQLSYDQMIRIRDQIMNFPTRLQWTLDVGNHWQLQRNGDTLDFFKSKGSNHGTNAAEISVESTLPWTVVNSQTNGTAADLRELSFGPSILSTDYSEVKVMQVKESGNIKFTPPWRKGRSAMKIKEFLRGQKVPLHLRDEAIILSDDSSRFALAVFLEGTGDNGDERWIVNADFCPQDGLPITNVVLRKKTF